MISRSSFAGILLVFMFSFSAFGAESDNSPLAIGLFPPLQLPNSGYGIKGLRLSLVGVHRASQGIDLAVLGNSTTNKFGGIAIAGLYNHNRALSSVVGLQLAGIANLNNGPSKVYGVQVAGFNKAGTVYGLQLGLINVATELHGIQIGLFNINKTGPFKGSPIINVAF